MHKIRHCLMKKLGSQEEFLGTSRLDKKIISFFFSKYCLFLSTNCDTRRVQFTEERSKEIS